MWSPSLICPYLLFSKVNFFIFLKIVKLLISKLKAHQMCFRDYKYRWVAWSRPPVVQDCFDPFKLFWLMFWEEGHEPPHQYVYLLRQEYQEENLWKRCLGVVWGFCYWWGPPGPMEMKGVVKVTLIPRSRKLKILLRMGGWATWLSQRSGSKCKDFGHRQRCEWGWVELYFSLTNTKIRPDLGVLER